MKASSKSPLSLAWSQTLFRRLVLDGFRLPTGLQGSAGVSGRIIGKLTRHPSSNGNHDWFAHVGAMRVLPPTLAYSILRSILPRRMNGGEPHGLRFDHGWASASIPSACRSGRKLKQRLAASCDEQQKCSRRMVPIWLPDGPLRNQSLQSRDHLDSLYIFHPAWFSVWIDRFLARHHSFILIAMFGRVQEWVPLCGRCKLLLLCCLQQQNVAIAEMCYRGLNVYESTFSPALSRILYSCSDRLCHILLSRHLMWLLRLLLVVLSGDHRFFLLCKSTSEAFSRIPGPSF